MATTKPQLPSLKTPHSASFPSEMRSPCVSGISLIKQEDNKTPITPPAAYLDFLSKMSPTAGMMSPLSAVGTTRFVWPEKPPMTAPLTAPLTAASIDSTSSAATSTSSTSTAPAEISCPASPKSSSSRSSSCSSHSNESITSTTSRTRKRPESISGPKGVIIPPPSPFVRPVSARTPRRLHIPQSPFSPATARSPLSATSIYSPYSTVFSPRDPTDPEKSRTTSVSVRQVVTRTVTHYSRTPVMEPVPPSKKRKLEAEEQETS